MLTDTSLESLCQFRPHDIAVHKLGANSGTTRYMLDDVTYVDLCIKIYLSRAEKSLFYEVALSNYSIKKNYVIHKIQ